MDPRSILTRYEALQRIAVDLLRAESTERILPIILEKAVDLMECDGGSLYLARSPSELVFEHAFNRSIDLNFTKRTLSIGGNSLASHCFRTGQSLNIADAYQLPAGVPYRIDLSFDHANCYRTKSVLVHPLQSSKGERLGVMQLINRKPNANMPWPIANSPKLNEMPNFSQEDEQLLSSFASLASASIENSQLYERIAKLFESFVKASIRLIEQRDPTTRGHSERVATLCLDLARHVSRSSVPALQSIHFTETELEELRLAALLHDFGKVNVREEVLLKAEKLSSSARSEIRHRIDCGILSQEVQKLRALLKQLEKERRPPSELELKRLQKEVLAYRRQTKIWWDTILQLNLPTVLDVDKTNRLKALLPMQVSDADCHPRPLLTPAEAKTLSIKRGSLSEEERLEIESHVTHTYEFLRQIPWGSEFKNLAEIAYAHHEKLDGSGYPRKLVAKDIPVQSRIMAICDIYDALVASDRPYKAALSPEQALSILQADAKAGKLDSHLLTVFIEGKIYRSHAFVRLQRTALKKAA